MKKKKRKKKKTNSAQRNLKRKRDCNESSSLIGYVLVKFNYVMMYAFRCTGLPSYARHKQYFCFDVLPEDYEKQKYILAGEFCLRS